MTIEDCMLLAAQLLLESHMELMASSKEELGSKEDRAEAARRARAALENIEKAWDLLHDGVVREITEIPWGNITILESGPLKNWRR